MSSVPGGDLDEQVKEYLLYRGFTSAARAFEVELNKSSTSSAVGGANFSATSSGFVDKACNVDKLVDSIMNLISVHDLIQLTNLWNFISRKFLTNADAAQSVALRKIELSLYRCYLVNCVTSGRSDKVVEFFEKSAKLLPHYDWGEWYGLPYVKNPELNDRFAPFFQRSWQETFTISLHNFLNVVLFTSPKPSLMSYRQEASVLQNLKDENYLLKEQLTSKHQTSMETTLEAKIGNSSADNPGSQVRSPEEYQGTRSYLKEVFKKAIPKASSLAPYKGKLRKQPFPVIANSEASEEVSSHLGTSLNSVQQVAEVEAGASSYSAVLVNSLPPSSFTSSDCIESRSLHSTNKGWRVSADQASPAFSASLADSMKPALSSSNEPYIMLSKDIYSQHSSNVSHCRFSPSGSQVVSTDTSGIVKVWSCDKSTPTNATIMSKSQIMAVEWVPSKDDNLLLLGNDKSTIRLYDVANKRSVQEAETPSIFPAVISLCSSPTGSRLLSSQCSASHISSSITCWDMKTFQIERQLQLPASNVRAFSLDFNHNGSLVALGCSDGSVRIFDVQQNEQLMNWNVSNVKMVSVFVMNVKFSFDESTVYTLCSNGTLAMWSLHKPGVKRFEFALTQKSINFQISNFYPRLFATDSQDRKFVVPSENGFQILKRTEDDFKSCQKIATSGKAASCLDWCVASSTAAVVNGASSNSLVVCQLLEK